MGAIGAVYETIAQRIDDSPYKKVYWFARQLVNNDKYGALGTKKESKLVETVSLVEALMTNDSLNDDQRFKVAKHQLLSEIEGMYKEGSKSADLARGFWYEINDAIQTLDDLAIFCFTVRHVVVAVNHAMSQVPSDDKDFAIKQARAILDELGYDGIGHVVLTWDSLGERGCLDAERALVVEQYQDLLYKMGQLTIDHNDLDDALISTALVQEFERRLGQKRTGRAGRSLESVVSFLFDYYNIPSASAPEHFSIDLEIDKWFACNGGRTIGISCKRTLRERWKNLIGANRDTLSRFRIRELWHIITYDADLSENKVVDLGKERHFFYLRDDSPQFERLKSEIVTADYVRPLSQLIEDIQRNRQQ